MRVGSATRYSGGFLLLLSLAALIGACSKQSEVSRDRDSPELTFKNGVAVVSGCDGKLGENAKGACPYVLCKAAILNSGGVDVMGDIQLEGGPISEDATEQLIVGRSTSAHPDASSVTYVQCRISRGKIVRAGVITERQYNAVRYERQWL